MASSRKQSSISKFFAPTLKSKGPTVKNETIHEKKAKNGESFKRPYPSNGVDHNKKKKLKVNNNDEGASVSSDVRKRLSSFRSQKDFTEEMNGDTQPVGKSPKLASHKCKTLTPLEQQVIAIKEENPDVLLFVECGYKYRFFGEDAEIASKELNIMSRLDHNFLTGSIPTHRLHVHVRRLVAKGYKVGVVKQKETAALKAVGTNKSAPFRRELSEVYTRATLIGEDVTPSGEEEEQDVNEGTTVSLMVLTEAEAETKKGAEPSTDIAFVAIQPITGEMVYDHFTDSATRMSLWTRLEHIQPVEVVFSDNVSHITREAVRALTTRHGDCIRVEVRKDFDYSACLRSLCELHQDSHEKIKRLADLPQSVVCCLGATLNYLKEFKLERIIKTSCSMTKFFTEKQYMKLPGSTVRNLEILKNCSNGEEKGSLFWVLNRTCTKFGARVLREWLLRPLTDVQQIRQRQDVIEELMTSGGSVGPSLKSALLKAPDFERAITSIFYKKCSPYEFWTTVNGLKWLHGRLSAALHVDARRRLKSQWLASLLDGALGGLSGAHAFAHKLNENGIRENKKTKLLNDWTEFEDVSSKKEEIKEVEAKLNELKSHIARVVCISSFDYCTVSGLEYLIEVKNSKMNVVPNSWNKINMTKVVSRFRSPDVEKLYSNLLQMREELEIVCHEAWLQILDSFSVDYLGYREAIKCLGILDALLSLASAATEGGYVRPEVAPEEGEGEGGAIDIVDGKHPIVSQLSHACNQYVANDTNMKLDGERVMLVTGPNMGGKSCYMRQVALLVLMAQTGSFVPAASARIAIVDGIYTRMGASDDIYEGRSTFMTEAVEAAEIMRDSTSKSLVILDELGRGTATHDGLAVATAALDFFVNQVKCFVIFVTHYLPLTKYQSSLHPSSVGNFHMGFLVSDGEREGVEPVTFLYQLTSGGAKKSYGLHVARLANVAPAVIERAAAQSAALQSLCSRQKKRIEALKKLFDQTVPPRAALESIQWEQLSESGGP